MRLSYAVSLLPLAAFVGALEVTSPKKGEDVDLSGSFTVTWDSVSTDPSTFDLYLVNNAVYPSVEKKVASNVDTSKGSYTVSGLSGVTDGNGYQINFLSTSTQNSGILAQSQQFTVEGGSSSSTTTASASLTTSASTSTSSGSTSTGTETSSSSSSSTGSTTSSESSTITSTSSKLTTTTSAANTLSTTASSTRSASASSTESASASGTESTAPVSTGAGMALAAPVSVAAGLVMGVVAMQL
ncbi:hypothetical protein AbraIFM66951_007301 [Aspergillus brasiliensis]|uniref:Yeast cell wall synthesis Kre9/Knh1-like N-terminal domain-containing protein n=1 Tax=Aspergillus brasiliensis TaxID=319629 RepID=A0A9W5YQW1_9EURO|nr:hypothetical protein AbraCBS73388_007856 [Aspergillus brasiliensis]GKZ44956.1 hypothetical protein AbraIFM66951_007301 [Aspergillus brasiliensis]